MKLIHRLTIVLLLSAAGAVLAGSLLLQHYGETSAVASGLCGETDSGCDRVNQSAYAKVAGVPWAAVGLVFYLAVMAGTLIALAAPDDARQAVGAALFLLFAAGLGVDGVLFAIQAFRIHAYCKLCLGTYAVNVAALAVFWPMRRSLPTLRGAAESPAARVAAAGWVLAALSFALGTTAATAALRQREERRAATILGEKPAAASATPEPAASAAAPTPEPPTSDAASPDLRRYQEQLKVAQDEAKRLKDTLDDPQKYEQYQAQKSLSDFAKNPEAKIALEDTPRKGPDAPIKIVEYSDFLCPFCRQIAQAFNGYLPHTDNRVAVHYKFYPLDDACNPHFQPGIDPGACWLAYGAVCAHQQGKFWPYHDKVFGMEPPKTPPDRQAVVKIAGESFGLNESSFGACIGSSSTKDRVLADVAEGAKAGIKGTPTIFINNRRLPRTSEFLQAVDQESKRLGLGPMPGVP